jgi:lipopolysaccharide export LptBFGC system permease protein LptF
VSLDDLRGWGGREVLLAVLALALVLALVVVALVDWVSA